MAADIEFSDIEYEPLTSVTSIRLIILERGSGSDPVQCQLFHAELGSRDFEALSYEWGTPRRTGNKSTYKPEIGTSIARSTAPFERGRLPKFRPITVRKPRNVPHTSFLSRLNVLGSDIVHPKRDLGILVNGEKARIKQNLYDALRHIRSAEKERCLWIDALCINQSDKKEKSRQVSLMGRIYSEACHVIAWLGSARDHSDLAMDTLNQLVDLIENEAPAWQEWIRDEQSAFNEMPENVLKRAREIRGRAAKAAIKHLAARSYWTRIWIVQEIQLAQKLTLYCGTKYTPASALLLHTYMLDAYDTMNFLFAPGTILLGRRASRVGQFSIRQWLCYFSCSTTSDWSYSEPRDLIYALLAISSDCCHGQIQPDYSKPLADVYADVLAVLKKGIGESSPFEALTALNGLAFNFGFIDLHSRMKNDGKLIDGRENDVLLPSEQMEKGLVNRVLGHRPST